ncbi:hypothetical protein GGTG_13188 [Gaeumannomyces tritici R3-111a-1]|uniref:Uncharacterized protein n=1 Tax=Gaeumannomyces tritici (strain R3-111a-1) TaxID=644352 RepID=J3PI60_GAET3|nr:hypothetical protein GGTG_13188 [Gaeumannomyces tritici R3-111a-1]EJT69572.1 hypothetical protein GGTG_13188 [Gaeumannomyces tritici R3-111a-1]
MPSGGCWAVCKVSRPVSFKTKGALCMGVSPGEAGTRKVRPKSPSMRPNSTLGASASVEFWTARGGNKQSHLFEKVPARAPEDRLQPLCDHTYGLSLAHFTRHGQSLGRAQGNFWKWSGSRCRCKEEAKDMDSVLPPSYFYRLGPGGKAGGNPNDPFGPGTIWVMGPKSG